MSDLFIGIVIVVIVSSAAYAATRLAGERLSRRANRIIAVVSICGFCFYLFFLWRSAWLISLLPFSNLVIIGNWFPIAAAVLAAHVCQRLRGLRRAAWLLVLGGFSAFAVVHPLLGDPPNCGDQWTDDGICLQSTEDTCAPACAATLLRQYGIDATEREMAELCLTREGTSWLGLYRGLKLKTRGTPWKVEVVRCHIEQLVRTDSQPMILMVGIDHAAGDNADLRDEDGWIPGVGHAVVLRRFNDRGRVEVLDPSPAIGRDEWTTNELRQLWRGSALRLSRR